MQKQIASKFPLHKYALHNLKNPPKQKTKCLQIENVTVFGKGSVVNRICPLVITGRFYPDKTTLNYPLFCMEKTTKKAISYF
jgi:hypothetical protein